MTRALRIAPGLVPALAALLLAGALGACSPNLGAEGATGAVVGGAPAGRSLAPDGDRVACEFDPLYQRDVCYRY